MTPTYLAGLGSIFAGVVLLTLVTVSALSSPGGATEQGVIVALAGVLLALVATYIGAELLAGPSQMVLAASAASGAVAAILVLGYLVFVGAQTLSAWVVLLIVLLVEIAVAGVSGHLWLDEGDPLAEVLVQEILRELLVLQCDLRPRARGG